MTLFLRAVAIFVLSLIVLSNREVAALSWNIECTNNSCSATSGALRVFWSQHGKFDEYRGVVTGVSGLPISLSDFQAAQQSVSMGMDKSMQHSERASASAAVNAEEARGLSASAGASEEFSFSKRRSISRSQNRGQDSRIDHTLNFVRWYAEVNFHDPNRPSDSIRPIMDAMASLNGVYADGFIEDYLAAYWLFQEGDSLEKVDLSTPLDDDNKLALLIKYHLLNLNLNSAPNDNRRLHDAMQLSLLMLSSPDVSHRIALKLASLRRAVEPAVSPRSLRERNIKDYSRGLWLYVELTDPSSMAVDKETKLLLNNWLDSFCTNPSDKLYALSHYWVTVDEQVGNGLKPQDAEIFAPLAVAYETAAASDTASFSAQPFAPPLALASIEGIFPTSPAAVSGAIIVIALVGGMTWRVMKRRAMPRVQ